MDTIDAATQQIVSIDWEHVRLEYLNTNLEAAVKDGTPPLSLKVLAEKYGLNYGTLRNRASEEDWSGQLAVMRTAHKEAIKDRVVHLTLQSEIEIRARQVSYARLAQDVAMQRLLEINPAELTPKETIELLKLGTELERKAAGMEDGYIQAPGTLKDTQTREAVRQAMTALQRFRERLKLNAPVPA